MTSEGWRGRPSRHADVGQDDPLDRDGGIRDKDGFLVLDSQAQEMFSSGLGADAQVAESLIALWRNRHGVPLERVSILAGFAQPLMAVAIHEADAICFLIFALREGDHLAKFLASVHAAPDILRHLLTDPDRAIVVVDRSARISYMSPVHEQLSGLKHDKAIGKPVTDVIENTQLQDVVRSGKAQIARLQEMNGIARVVSCTPIRDRAGKVAGAIEQVIFEGPETIRRLTTELSQVTPGRNFYRRKLSGMRTESHGLDQIIGRSDAVRRLKERIHRIAPLDVPVLLIGESGTGKEMTAHAIHMLSPRCDKALVLVNSAAIPPNLIESELFGYESGAFTGAHRKGRTGKFEAADGGTLLLDEIGDMPVDMQVKLLRVLQDGGFERIGDHHIRHSDFRLISASNRDFPSMIANSRFRLDLFYRISAVTLRLPSLRERLEDIPELADSFLRDFAARHGASTKSMTVDAIRFLQSLSWPGNIRQLQHSIEHAVIFSNTAVLRVDDFAWIDHGERPGHASSVVRTDRVVNVQATQTRIECELIVRALLRTGGNKKRAAEELGISRSYLYKCLHMMEAASPMGDRE